VEDARAATRRAASHVLATSAQDQRRRSPTSETADVERQERSPPKHAMIEVPLAVQAVGKLRAKDRALQTQLTRVGRFGNALRATPGLTPTAPPSVTPALTKNVESHKQRRTRENADAPGGMRSPWKFVRENPRSRDVGAKLAEVIDQFVDDCPDVSRWLLEEGAAGRAKYKGTGSEYQLLTRLQEFLGAKTLAFGKHSCWRSCLVRSYVAMAGDPELHLADWFEDGAPTGVAMEIPSCGIFPPVESAAVATAELQNHCAMTEPGRNYISVEQNQDLVQAETDRLIGAGFIEAFPTWEDLERRHGKVIVSKIAAIVKKRDDGSAKTRIIIDMLRSKVNSFVKLSERIVLPRLMDVVTDIIDLATAAAKETDINVVVDQMVLDFADAFHTIGVHPKEVPYQVFKLPGKQGFGCYQTVVFGGGGAPLTWGRAAALLGRSGQALFDVSEARIEIYVDDPWTAWRGSPERIRLLKTRLILWWLALGPDISWAKMQHGSSVKWIGAQVSVDGLSSVAVALPGEYAAALEAESRELLKLPSAHMKRVRQLAGKCAWASGFVPALGAMIAPLWAAIADTKVGRSHGFAMSGPVIPTVRIRHALLWIVAFAVGKRGTLRSVFSVLEHRAPSCISMEFDASPWGFGGVLFWQGWPWEFFSSPITEEDITRFGIKIGDPAFQALLENLAILIGVRHWLPKWKDLRLTVRIRSDSQAALGAWVKERSSNQKVNMVVRETALDMAEGRYKIDVFQHLPGRLNDLADALSRMFQPAVNYSIPNGLAECTQVFPAQRDDVWWRAAGEPSV